MLLMSKKCAVNKKYVTTSEGRSAMDLLKVLHRFYGILTQKFDFFFF